ncbi:MAG: 50S ribosomal protein L11 methyltransferase [Clostridia bacterium]|nr:50S ribosomal protein L11 methyltransferase [Clostridia bacterium]
MEWLEVTVHTTSIGSELIAEILEETGSHGASIEDRNDLDDMQRPAGEWDMIDPNLYEKAPADVLVKGYYAMGAELGDQLSDLRFRLGELSKIGFGEASLGTLVVETKQLEEEDWANNWKKYFKPFLAGKHIVVKPTWEEYTPKAGEKILEMDPGMAFGSGTHETTSMCVSLIEEITKEGMHVIDVGCGSGILSIAALMCGAKDALAIDIDPVATRVARENAKINGYADRIEVREGNLVEEDVEKCDLMVANIVADVIIHLAPTAAGIVKEGGYFICSGIIREREQEVIDAVTGLGFTPVSSMHRGEWCALCYKR